jgi:hypothetical protein
VELGVFAVGIVVVVAVEEDGGGGGGGIVEFNEASILFIDIAAGAGDVAEIVSLDIVGGDDAPVPLTTETDVLSDFVVVDIASEFDDGESGCSTTGGGGGGGSSS